MKVLGHSEAKMGVNPCYFIVQLSWDELNSIAAVSPVINGNREVPCDLLETVARLKDISEQLQSAFRGLVPKP